MQQEKRSYIELHIAVLLYGLTAILGDLIQLPAVILEGPISRTKNGYELGNNLHWTYTDVIFHVIGEDDTSVNRISDILDRQMDKTILMFDMNRMTIENRFPLDYRGSKNDDALTYPSLVAATGDGGYRYNTGTLLGKLTISDSNTQNGAWIHQNVYHQTVKWTTEVVLIHY